MNFFTKLFNKAKQTIRNLSSWMEVGGFKAIFSPFGRDANRSELVRSCVRALADQTAKASPTVSGTDNEAKRLERMLKYRPNPYMNGKDFLYKVRTQYELTNTAFITIMRDDLGKVQALYPMPYQTVEALKDDAGNLYIKFYVNGNQYTFSWADVVVLRKDYNEHDIVGDSNDPILNTLNLINTSNQGISNAIKSTANLRGIVKSTKAMLDPKDQKAQGEQFVKDYLSLENEGGVAYLDNTMEFTPITMQPATTNWTTMREFRENLFRYFGVDDEIILSKATPEKMQVFYELRIEPFLIALSLELTSKIYTDREIAFGREITYQSSAIQFMSMSDKLALRPFLEDGAITPNTWCDIVGLPHVEGGDKPIRRLDTAPIDKIAKALQDKNDKNDEDKEDKDTEDKDDE